MAEVSYQPGIPETQLRAAAELYDEAFGQKFALAIPRRKTRVAFLEACLVPEFAFCALADGKLVGLAGFHTQNGSLTGGAGLRQLFSQLGFFSGLRAAVVFSLYEREPAKGELLMDGVAVNVEVRGQGVGGRLLGEIIRYAHKHAYDYVRLDVIDTNEGAKRLYARKEFEETHVQTFPYLKSLLGFGGVTTMRLAVIPKA